MEKYQGNAEIPKPPIGELHVQPPEGRPELKKEAKLFINPESGVFDDYINEFDKDRELLKMMLSGEYDLNNLDDLLDLKLVTEHLNQKFSDGGKRKYQEYFPENLYGEVLDDQNIAIVRQLDDKVNELNLVMSTKMDAEDFAANRDKIMHAAMLYDDIISLIKTGKAVEQNLQKAA